MNFGDALLLVMKIPLTSVLFIFLILFASITISAIRYKIILRDLFSSRINLTKSFLIICSAQLSCYIFPFRSGVIVTKPKLTEKYSDASLKKSFAAVVTEQFFEIGWQILLLPFLLYMIGKDLILRNPTTKIVIFLAIVSSVILCVINYRKLIRLCFRFVKFMPKWIKAKIRERGINASYLNDKIQNLATSFCNWKFFVKILTTTLILILIHPLILMIIAQVFKVTISYKSAFLAYWISVVVGKVSGLPGGIGAKDLTLVVALTLFKIDAIIAINIAILFRVVVFIFITLFGLPLVLKLGKGAIKKIYRRTRRKNAKKKNVSILD